MPVLAAQNGVGAQTGNGSQQVVNPSISVSSVGNKVENKVQTQNQGIDSQLQISTEENLSSEVGKSMDVRSEKALQNMSEVAKQVQGMLEIKTTGGIGDQVRVVAKEQNQAQEKIQENMMKMDAKSGIMKKLFGPDYKSMRSLNLLIEENNIRIEALQKLLINVQNYADRTQIEATIQSIVDQNTSLQERLQEEQKLSSLFGWLVQLFNQE